ncbi:GntR family transcriptional regulator [Evansella sp. AB-rgal1]|uniref:GntR family transcriptional regulator n=1 Tax=Evansella sp. AB-rgal1 TaxID=3242696 RepID=UPI00359D439D
MINVNTSIRGSTRDFVYRTIRNQIINWELLPGQKMSEKEVSEKLNVSRTPVREAFLQLSQENLLQIYPQIGTVVSKIDYRLVEEARFVREKIERALVMELCNGVSEDFVFQMESNLAMQELCIQKGTHQRLFQLDDEYHHHLYKECNKKRAWSFVRQLNSSFDRLRSLRLAMNADWKIIVSQHKEVYNYILDRDAKKADKAIENHLTLILFEKEDLQKKYPDYFI